MKHFSHLLAIIAVTLMIASCNNKKDATGDLANNPLLNPAETYLNTPDFNSIKVEHYKPAFYEAMRIHSAEIEAIANNSEAPTFENTIVAMEKSGSFIPSQETLLTGARLSYITYVVNDRLVT